jgi:hypothetical protein
VASVGAGAGEAGAIGALALSKMTIE